MGLCSSRCRRKHDEDEISEEGSVSGEDEDIEAGPQKASRSVADSADASHAQGQTSPWKAVLPQDPRRVETLVVLLPGDRSKMLGVTFDPMPTAEPPSILVRHIFEGTGLIPDWNKMHPAMAVRPDDHIVEVNGIRGDCIRLAAELARPVERRLTVCRGRELKKTGKSLGSMALRPTGGSRLVQSQALFPGSKAASCSAPAATGLRTAPWGGAARPQNGSLCVSPGRRPASPCPAAASPSSNMELVAVSDRSPAPVRMQLAGQAADATSQGWTVFHELQGGTPRTPIPPSFELVARPDGRQELARAQTSGEQVVNSLALEAKGQGRWAVKGLVYEYQAIKIGLRTILKIWDKAGGPPQSLEGKGWAKAMRKDLLVKLSIGKRELQSVLGRELSETQPDVKHMPVHLLLQLKCRYLAVRPGSLGEIHEVFLQAVDTALCSKLGELATGALGLSAPELARLGCEAVVLLACSATIPAPKLWAWWISPERRIYFDANTFSSQGRFPVDGGGVLEFSDYSKKDPHDPMGRHRRLDWQIRHVLKEAELLTAAQARARRANDSNGHALTEKVVKDARSSLKHVPLKE